MSIMVTGGSGFIGSRLLREIDNSFTFDFTVVGTTSGDIRSYNNVYDQLKGVEGIVHLAAVSRVKDCEIDPYNCAEINVLGTLNVIDAAVKNNVKWMVLVSTGEVKWLQNDLIKSFYKTDNLYGLTKIAGELILDLYNTKYQLNSAILRISSVVFGGLDDNQDKVFPIFLKRAVCGEPIIINDTSSKWDFIHVSHVVNKISESIQLIKSQECSDSVLEVDVTSGVELDLFSLAKIIQYLSKSFSSIECDGEIVVKVEDSEYMGILEKNNVSSQFISCLKSELSEYRNHYCS